MAKTKTKSKPDSDKLIALFTVDQSVLDTLVGVIGQAVSSRPTHPVLANILFQVDQETQSLTLFGFDLTIGIKRTVPVFVTMGGTFTLPAKLLSDIVSKLPAGAIEFAIYNSGDEDPTAKDSDGNPIPPSPIAYLSVGRSSYEIRGMAAANFPEFPELEDTATEFTLAFDELFTGLQHTLFSTSADETKQVLTAVHFDASRNGFEFASTDGHRLSVLDVPFEEPSEDDPGFPGINVPSKTLMKLMRLLHQDHPETIAFRYDDSQIVMSWENSFVFSRLLEGQYPNYRQLIPRQFSKRATIDRAALVKALSRVAVLADQKNNIVVLTFSETDQELEIGVEAADVGSCSESLAIQYEDGVGGADDPFEVAFNVKYLLDALKTMESAEISISMNTRTSPAIINLLSDTKYTYLVMPVQIRTT